MQSISVSMFNEHGGHRLRVDLWGARAATPPMEHIAFYAGLGLLALLEVIEWPLAVTMSVGHVLMEATHRPGLHALGEALQEA